MLVLRRAPSKVVFRVRFHRLETKISLQAVGARSTVPDGKSTFPVGNRLSWGEIDDLRREIDDLRRYQPRWEIEDPYG